MFFIAQPDLLNFLIRTLKAWNTFMINPYPNWRFISFLDCHDPIIVTIHRNDIICMALHEDLLSSINVFSDEDATSRIINLIVFEDEIGIMKRAKWECSRQLKEWVGRKNSNNFIWFIDRWYILTSSFFICTDLFTFYYWIREFFWWLHFLFF